MIAKLRSLVALNLFMAITVATASENPERGKKGWQWTLQGGAVHQFESSLDSGGDMSASRFFVSGGIGKMFYGRWRLGAALGYGETDYSFSGNTGFGGLDPWNRIRDLRVSLPIQYFASESWTLYAIPTLRYNAESGASLSDGRNGGVLAGAAYRINDRLTIGPGFGVFSEIEDDTSFFPILIIDWKISDSLSLETGRGFGATRGPGLQLRWKYSPRWQFALGGRYEKTRFRLDDSGPAPGGVGQDKAIPLFIQAEYQLSKDIRFSLIGGAETGAKLRLEDDDGQRISSSDLSTAPFLGATFQARF